MQTKELNPDNLGPKEDWEGNNIALECPICGKVFIVSERLHGERRCPSCGKSRGVVTGGRQSGGRAAIHWTTDEADAFVLGRTYTREEIKAALGGSPVEYLPCENGRVVCGCFTRDHNPEAPEIIVPGTGPVIEREAQIFCEQKSAIPIFLKVRPHAWEYVGKYRADRFSTDPQVIAAHHKGSVTPLNEITRVIFLTKGEIDG